MWGEGSSRAAHAANLLVCIAGCAADPTGLTVTGAAATGVLSLKDIFKASTPDAKALVKAITTDLEAALEAPQFHMPARGPALLPQMLEAALPAPSDLLGRNLNPDAILGLMLDRLTDSEHRQPEMAEAFCNWVRPSLTRLLADATFVQSLAPQIAAETLSRLSELADALVSLSSTYGTLARSLEDLRHLHQSQLEVLALRFGLAPTRGTDARALIGLLEQKAEDLRALTADTQAMRGLSDRTDNLLSAIEADIAALRLTEAKEKLAAAREVQTETLRKPLEFNAALMERQAQIALLENDAERAYTLFTAAADSFAAISPVEVAKRRRDYAERLADHGTRYGGAGLPLAIRLLNRLLEDLPRDTFPWHWAAAQNSLAIACETLGQRTGGPPGTALLSRAVAAYEQALEVVTRADYPEEWAVTMQNLAGALQAQGERTAGEAGTALLSRAVAAYEQALTVRTRADHPLHWATTIQNLAGALQRQGESTAGEPGTALLSRAVVAYEQAQQVYTRADHPVNWATTMQNLATALAAQGERTAGEAGTTLLARAVAAHEQALEVRTRADHPVQWAMTQENLAICHAVWSEHPACDDLPAHLRMALEHVDHALTVYDPDHMPYDHGTATRLRKDILSRLSPNP